MELIKELLGTMPLKEHEGGGGGGNFKEAFEVRSALNSCCHVLHHALLVCFHLLFFEPQGDRML
jgi:hypothetical protein